ncbi:glutathione S-transferase [Paraglaciecola marina]|uniref:glutathione S-transferase n=1 Tax=Paraglaciecola marina TaxID=2500157 RepID=UPI00105D56F2|nr:glutathione S-transferase [Paraglaciecola marina]
MALPVLYSLRNCPYAMRARIAIYKSKQTIELRDVVLKDKPAEMLIASPKGTVPTLVLSADGQTQKVIDESLDVMLWALQESDPDNLLRAGVVEGDDAPEISANLTEILDLVYGFDHEFKGLLEAYKCAKRYHETNLLECRQACEVYIQDLEKRLSSHAYLMDDHESLADIAILPFIRQFAKVERQWYLQSPYPQLKQWLNKYLQSPMFNKVMTNYPIWHVKSEPVVFGFS